MLTAMTVQHIDSKNNLNQVNRATYTLCPHVHLNTRSIIWPMLLRDISSFFATKALRQSSNRHASRSSNAHNHQKGRGSQNYWRPHITRAQDWPCQNYSIQLWPCLTGQPRKRVMHRPCRVMYRGGASLSVNQAYDTIALAKLHVHDYVHSTYRLGNGRTRERESISGRTDGFLRWVGRGALCP